MEDHRTGGHLLRVSTMAQPNMDYGMDLTEIIMMTNHRRMHGTETDIDWDRLPASQIEHILMVYEVRLPINI